MIREFYGRCSTRATLPSQIGCTVPGYRYHDITIETGPVDHETSMGRNASFAAAFPDRTVTIEDLIASSDRSWRASDRHFTVVCREFNAGPDADEIRMLTGRSGHCCPTTVF